MVVVLVRAAQVVPIPCMSEAEVESEEVVVTQAERRTYRTGRSSERSAAGILRAAALSGALFASCAQAQNALGDGTGLANPLDVYQQQLRSESRTDQFRRENAFREAIVTGRAVGGSAFRGDVGYGSGTEFRGELGSDANYAFRRDSALSGVAAQGISGAQALQYQFSLSTGSPMPSGFAGNGVYARPGGFSPSLSMQPSAMGVQRFAESSAIQSVPLANRSFSELAAAGESLRAEARDLRSISGLLGQRSLGPSTLQTIETGLGRPSYQIEVSPISGVRTREVLSPLVVGQSGRLAETPSASRVPSNSPGSLSMVNRMTVERPDLAVEPSRPVTGPDGQVLQPDLDAPQPADPARPGDPTQPADRPEGFDPLAPMQPEQPLDQIESPVMDPARFMMPSARMDEIRRRLVGEPPEDENPMLSPEEAELLGDLPMVEELVVRSEGLAENPAYALHMARGQELLAEGMYFDAEERFVTALSIRPEDPTALIGRTHAQLGAGLLLSAASNLRSVFQANPEIVGVRYAKGLLPKTSRLETMLNELTFARSLPPAGAGLLRAYVGYQYQDAALLSKGLEELAAGDQADKALAELLGAVWRVSEQP